jgi:hypothetical protein
MDGIHAIILGLLLGISVNLALHSANCHAQGSYFNSTQEINRQQHQQEVMKQQQQILQQQYIQTQQLEHMRRDAEFRFNRNHDHLHLHTHQPIRY